MMRKRETKQGPRPPATAVALCVAGLLLAAAGPATSNSIGDESAPPQETCALCHGLNGVSRMSRFPRLAGQKAAYIEKQVGDFRAGRRSNDGGQMVAIVTEFSDAQVSQAAQYFAGLAPPEPIAGPEAEKAAAVAERLFRDGDEPRGIPACASCHLPDRAKANAKAPAYAPRLTAQHPEYIAKQLRDFREGNRENDGTGTMAQIAKALTEAEIGAVAVYLAARPREAANAD